MTLDRATWFDAQYNNRARIAQHPQIFQRWAADSMRARDRLRPLLDLNYGDGPNETLDVFPSVTAGAPVLVFIHGGWWRSLDKRDHSFLAPPFVARGTTVVLPNYALCPSVNIETIALQMVRALVWTYRHAVAFGGDPRRIVVGGHSAGGHLAAMLLCCRWPEVGHDLSPRLVKSALAVSGVFDLEPLRRTPFLQADLRLTLAAVRRLSPVRFPPPEGELFALVGGDESEEFLRQNQSIRQAWGPRAVPVCESLPGANHLDVLDGMADPQGRLHGLACRLLDAA